MLGDISYDVATLQFEGKKVFTFTWYKIVIVMSCGIPGNIVLVRTYI